MRNPYLNAYQNALEVEVEAASPHKLVLMLFDGAIAAIRQARIQMVSRNIAEKGRLIGKAVAIVDEGLRASLNRDAGGEMAANLDDLYEYCGMRLLEANLKNEPALLDEVERLLGEIRGAWAEIGKGSVEVPSEAPTRQGLHYGAA
ncbi:flagellar export chaperone FliS [Crenobacter cavernae]|uniref:Flagellar secretion chaperone FliS n=1 Tax=Crenobacter cavernae TaxID=2290923 RepID=A0ABY0FEU1_9NEIS|nr:flagellar export chaperone FliS [Crenobacter cavernae]RXZ44821.1 flagellar export chaperone FliS [Crenobacter cavernae]